MSNEKIFVGNAKEFTFQNGGSKIGLLFNLDDLNLMSQHVDSGGVVKVDLLKSQKGNHYMTINNWRPSQQTQQTQTQPAPQVQNLNTPTEDVSGWKGESDEDISF